MKTLQGSIKISQEEESFNAIVNAIQEGVKNTDIISILTTPYSKLALYRREDCDNQKVSAVPYYMALGQWPMASALESRAAFHT